MKFIVTYPLRLSTRNGYTEIEATDEHEARLMLNRRLGPTGWAGIYEDGDAARIISKYNLQPIPLSHGVEE